MNRDDKMKALDAALTQIEKAYGKGSVMKLGAIEPRIMLTPIGMDTAIAIRKTTNTNNAGIILLLLSPGQLLLLRLSLSVQSLLILFH